MDNNTSLQLFAEDVWTFDKEKSTFDSGSNYLYRSEELRPDETDQKTSPALRELCLEEGVALTNERFRPLCGAAGLVSWHIDASKQSSDINVLQERGFRVARYIRNGNSALR